VKGASLLRQRVTRATSHSDITRVVTSWNSKQKELAERKMRKQLSTSSHSAIDSDYGQSAYLCPIQV